MSKDDTVKIKEVISISKKEILEKYEMDDYYKNIIKVLYGEKIKNKIDKYGRKFTIDEYKSGFTIDDLNNEKGKVGCYIFVEEDVPVYIGVGGIGTKKDLRNRLRQELKSSEKDTGATLSRNIQKIDALLEDKEVTPENSVDKINTFDLVTITVGELNSNFVENAKKLETILIALFHPKYNK